MKELSGLVIGAAIEIHKQLGAFLLESDYEECLVYELNLKNLKVERQKPVPVIYKDVHLEYGYRIDLLIEDQLIVELKSVDGLLPIHEAQILTYMKFSKIKYGLLINFKIKLLKEGIRRFIL